MKLKRIKLSEVVKSLELLKQLCRLHETCSTCWLYDPEEKETQCFLVKTGSGSLAENIKEAKIYIAHEHSCIMPECPYCPDCKYGFISYPEDTMPGETDINTEWHCIYDPEVIENEAAAIPASMEGAAGADQYDRSAP